MTYNFGPTSHKSVGTIHVPSNTPLQENHHVPSRLALVISISVEGIDIIWMQFLPWWGKLHCNYLFASTSDWANRNIYITIFNRFTSRLWLCPVRLPDGIWWGARGREGPHMWHWWVKFPCSKGMEVTTRLMTLCEQNMLQLCLRVSWIKDIDRNVTHFNFVQPTWILQY